MRIKKCGSPANFLSNYSRYSKKKLKFLNIAFNKDRRG